MSSISWLTNSTLGILAQMRGGGGCGVSANECSCAHGAQINFGDQTPYLTYVLDFRLENRPPKKLAKFVAENGHLRFFEGKYLTC